MEDTPKSFIERCRLQFARDCEMERRIRQEAEIDLHYVAGENQWHDGVRQEREDDGRPCLVFSKLHTFVQRVVNDSRQKRPAGKVSPLGGGATTDVATVMNGILRHIDYRSHGDVATDTAQEYAAAGSFGFIRFVTEYADPKSFDQEVKILAVEDPFSVYGVLIPACRGEEPEHAFVIKRITREEYRREYGRTEPMDFQSEEWKDADDWIDEKSVRIAEYWWRTKKTRKMRMIQGADGSTAPIYSDNPHFDEPLKFVMDLDSDEPAPLERDVEEYEVRFCTIDGARKLPGTETVWVGDTIPIEAVLGRQMIVDGEVKLFSLIRPVRDPQQLINIYKTSIAEKLSLANRVPYIGPIGTFTDQKWLDANRKNYPYLEYTPVLVGNGVLAPPPQRQQLEEQIQALSMAAMQEVDDLKSGMGIYDASLGQKGNETSGIGIARRQQQADTTNFHFGDNLNRAIWSLYRKIIKIIPKVYDRPGRQVRIVGEDQEHAVITVNQPYRDPVTGAVRHHQLDVGEYDVVVSVGPSYNTARQEGADTLQQFFQAAPQTIPILGDLWVGSLDYPWAREGARRLKAAAPPQIVNDPGATAPIPPQAQQAIEQLQMELQKTHAFAQSLHEQLQTKQPEIEAKIRMQQAELDFKREQLAEQSRVELAKLGIQTDITRLEAEIEALKHQAGLKAQADMKQADREHQMAMQTNQQIHEANQNASDQVFQADQAQQEQEQQEEPTE